MNQDVILQEVRERYGSIAREVLERGPNSCGCGEMDSACCSNQAIPEQALAALKDAAPLPADIIQSSLGCGTPLEAAALQPGETVLDLGSGGGLDCFYAAQLVGPSGRVIGVDMTPDMLQLANANLQRVGLKNVEFRRGLLEELPLESNSVDVVISNCVINLSPDKDRVFQEAFRVLKPGGRVALSDEVARVEIPAGLRKNMQSWSACVSGAITAEQYRAKMQAAGFVGVRVEGDQGAELIYSAKFMADKPAAG